MKTPREQVLEFITNNSGVRFSDVDDAIDEPTRVVEDAIWNLWQQGTIQINPDSTMRPTRKGEMVFRHDG